MYKLLRDLLFLFPPEGVHHFSMDSLKRACRWGWMRRQIAEYCHAGIPPDRIRTTQWGLPFRNPVGLGAGFDKNALYLAELDALDFGFVEIGTVTPKPQSGNEKPRLFRLKQDQALVNRMGFNNDGVERIAERLRDWRAKYPDSALIVGGNIGKNKTTPNEEAWKDYEAVFVQLYDHVDYFVVNVSSPNTPGLRALQEREALHRILTNLQEINGKLAASPARSAPRPGFAPRHAFAPRPILLKIAPDLGWQQIDEIVDLAMEIRLDGLVAANTTIGRQNLLTPADRLDSIGAGGLSGAPLSERATDMIRYIQAKTQGAIPLIASGGIFTGEDARQRLTAGACLIQVWTGFIYEGPLIVRRICQYLADHPLPSASPPQPASAPL